MTMWLSLLLIPLTAVGAPVEEALKAESPLLRRAAIRSAAAQGVSAVPLLIEHAREDPDLLVRRNAIRLLSDLHPRETWVPFLAGRLEDSEPLVRLVVVEELATCSPRTGEINTLLLRAAEDPAHAVGRMAREALWPYHASVRSVRTVAEFADLSLKEVWKMELPEKGWRFQRDPQRNLHLEECFMPGYDDHHWHYGATGRPWQADGHEYEGVAWYRLSFELPERPANGEAADLVFGAVDESAWIWLNGEYLGAHDIGPDGWNRSFGADASTALKWGAINHLVVRVAKLRGNHGGIWKPVYLEVLSR